MSDTQAFIILVLLAGAVVANLRIVDSGAEQCFTHDMTSFVEYAASSDMGYVTGVGGRLPIRGSGLMAELITCDTPGRALLVLLPCQHCPGLNCRSRSSDSLALAGVDQTMSTCGQGTTAMYLTHTDASGTTHVSTCDTRGRLHATRHVDRKISTAEARHFFPEMPKRGGTVVVTITAGGQLRRFEPGPEERSSSALPAGLVLGTDPTVLLTRGFQDLHIRMGGVSQEATIRSLKKWEEQEIAVGQTTQRTRYSRTDERAVQDAMRLARAKRSPLKPVDTPEMRQHVGSEARPFKLGSHVGGDHPGSKMPAGYDGSLHVHLWMEFSTDSVYVGTHKSKHPTTVLEDLGKAARKWGLDWDLSSHNFAKLAQGEQVRVYTDDATCHKGEFLSHLNHAGYEKITAYPGTKTAHTFRVEQKIYTISLMARTNLYMAIPLCRKNDLRVRAFWPAAFKLAACQADYVPGKDGKCSRERRTGIPVTRNEFDRGIPAHFFAPGTHCMPRDTRSRRGHTTDVETGNTTITPRGERVVFLHPDDSGRHVVFSLDTRRVFTSMHVTWHATCAPPPPSGSQPSGLETADWEQVRQNRALAALSPEEHDPFKVAPLPQLHPLTALSALIDMEDEIDPTGDFTVPLDDDTPGNAALVAAAAAAAVCSVDKDLSVIAAVANTAQALLAGTAGASRTRPTLSSSTADVGSGGAQDAQPTLSSSAPDVATGGERPQATGSRRPRRTPPSKPSSGTHSTAGPTTGTGARAAAAVAAAAARRTGGDESTAGEDVHALRAEVLQAYTDGKFWQSDEPFLPEYGSVSDESRIACVNGEDQVSGQYALMQSSRGLHIIDATSIEALVSATVQDDPGETKIDLVSYDDLRIAKEDNVPIPKNLQRALDGPYGKYWAKAFAKELSAFVEGVTFTRCRKRDVPRDARVCRLMCVLDRKYHGEGPRAGQVSRLKVRMVVLGHLLPVLEGESTKSSMPRLPTVRLLDHIGIKKDLFCFSADVACAFLSGKLEADDIYVALPKFLQPSYRTPEGEDELWHLKRACCGLRQASNAWENTLVQFLLSTDPDPARHCNLPLKRSQHDASLYYLDNNKLQFDTKYTALRAELVGPPSLDPAQRAEQQERLATIRFYFLIFVDDSRVYCSDTWGSVPRRDGVATTTESGAVLNDMFMARYSSVFTITGGRRDLHDPAAPPEEYLKMLIKYSRLNGCLRSTWSQDLALRKFLLSNSADKIKNAVKSPMDPDVARLITKEAMPSDDRERARELADLQSTSSVPANFAYSDVCTQYRSQVASANWFACSSYPMLSYAVSRLSVQMHAPTAVAVRAMKRLLRFMTSLDGVHLHYRRGETSDIVLTGQSDASLGDSDYGRSQFAWTCSLDDRTSAVFDWRSGKTALTIVSTMGTELHALSELARSIVGWRMLLDELGYPVAGATVVYTDSTSAMLNANHHSTHSKSRSVRLRSWYVRECVTRGEVKVCWRSGDELHVDGLTKATQPVKFQRQMAEAHGIVIA